MGVKTNSIDMVNGPLWGKILKFSALYMLTAFLQHLYSAADVMVVGRFAGQAALAGVGTCSVLVNLFLNFILGLSAGATVVLGQAMGADNQDNIRQTTHTTIAIAIFGGMVTLMGLFMAYNRMGSLSFDAFAAARGQSNMILPATLILVGFAAKADCPANLPTIIVSAAVYKCCKTAVSI